MMVEYNFSVNEKVVTIFGFDGIIELAAVGEEGVKYFVKTARGSDWYKENQLATKGNDYMPNNQVYLTEEKEK